MVCKVLGIDLFEDPGRRISVDEILEHRFFAGPIRELLPLRSIDYDEGTYVEDPSSEEYSKDIDDKERRHDQKNRVPNSRTHLKGITSDDPERPRYGDILQTRYPSSRPSKEPRRESRQTSRQTSGKNQIGLRTLLSEIGVAEDYQQLQQRVSNEWEADDFAPQRKSKDPGLDDHEGLQRPRKHMQSRRVSKDDYKGNVKPRRVSKEHHAPKQRVSSKESQHRRPSHQSDKTINSYTREKEAIYQVSESDENPRSRNPRGQSAPSPGEGLRNALGNLEHRIHRRASARDKPQSLDDVKNHGAEEGRAAGGKGFATLVEELVRPCSREEIRGTIPFLGGLLSCRRTETGF